MSIRIGAHVDQRDPVAATLALEGDCAQFFLGDPQSWKTPSVAYPGGAAALREAAAQADVALYVHAPYVINVASTNNRIRIPSRKLLQQTLTLAGEVGAAGVIVHGGHVTADDDPEQGFENWAKCVKGLDLAAPMLIENTAGGANAMARTLDRLALLWEAIRATPNGGEVGFCLDTCHAHAGGNELAGLVGRVTEITGRISLVHCNDSRDAFGSGADRHTTLGQGQIERADIASIVREADAPVILETPMSGVAEDILWLREQVG